MTDENDIHTYLKVAQGAVIVAAKKANTLKEYLAVWRIDEILPEDEYNEFSIRFQNAMLDLPIDDLDWCEKFTLVDIAYRADQIRTAQILIGIMAYDAMKDPIGFCTELLREMELDLPTKEVAYDILRKVPHEKEPDVK